MQFCIRERINFPVETLQEYDTQKWNGFRTEMKTAYE